MITIKPSFDLVSQPWIPIVDMHGVDREVGLREILADADGIRRIVGETPPMTAALHRLVLALLHRVFGPTSQSRWGELWSASKLDVGSPGGELSTYLTRWSDRFDLFDAEHPFLQCPALGSVARSSIAKLVPDRAVGNNVTLFDHTTAADRFALTPAAAARWLVTAQSFDPGGMKTPYERDKSSEKAPCATTSIVVVEGLNLKETLLLNALVYQPDAERPPMTTPDDAPAWELDPPDPRPDRRPARGWTDLLTWPSRRVALFPAEVLGDLVVTEVVLTPGTRLTDPQPDVEKMAAFRKPPGPKGKPKAAAPLLSVRLHPVRGVWRHSVELLLVDPRAEQRTRQRPRALTQIADLAERDLFPAGTLYTLRVLGQQLDSKASVVETYLEQEVLAPVALIRAADEDGSLAGLIGCAIELADEAGAALRYMQREQLKERRAAPTGDLDMAYWPLLATPFDGFLVAVTRARLTGRTDADATNTWARSVHATATAALARWAEGNSADGRNIAIIAKHQLAFQERLSTVEKVFRNKVQAYTNGAA